MSIRSFYVAVALLGAALCVGCAQEGQATPPAAGKISVQLSGTLRNATQDSIYLMQAVGANYETLAAAPLTKSGQVATFSFTASVPEKGMYLLGLVKGEQQIDGAMVLLGTEKRLEVEADAQQSLGASATFPNSALNRELRDFLMQAGRYQQQVNSLYQQIQQDRNAGGTRTERLAGQVDSIYKAQAAYYAQMRQRKDQLGTVASLYYYLPYEAVDPARRPATPEEWFAKEFLREIPFENPELAYYPIYYQRIRSYVTSLMAQFGYGADAIVKNLTPHLTKAQPGTKNHEVLLLAAIDGSVDQSAQQTPEFREVYFELATLYIEAYPQSAYTPALQGNLKQIGNLIRIGKGVPEIEEKGADGKTYKLSDLKGKVVLLDFWASWCGPCRRENPNVVAVYNQYKDKGFTVFSVSLDRDDAAWKAAITKDQLAWPYHVSDLGFWQSKHAKAYGVSSIPATFLLDKDGKVVAKNLRGPALEAKVKELLGQ
jgi:thiol-disulfide isomerase/thioredoxin